MNASKIVKVETTEVPYNSLKLEGKKPMTTSTVKRAASKKTAAKKVVSKVAAPANTKSLENETKSKRELAQVIFDKHFQQLARKDILVMLIADAGLTKAGANTYFQNMKKKFESVES